MRVDLERGGKRGLAVRFVMEMVRRYVGLVPGPLLFFTYRLKSIPKGIQHYISRGVGRNGAFIRSERELFAAFVSSLNTCRF